MRKEVLFLLGLIGLSACGVQTDAKEPPQAPTAPPPPTEIYLPTAIYERVVGDDLPSPKERWARPTIEVDRPLNIFFYGSSSTRMFVELAKKDPALLKLFGNDTISGVGRDGWDIEALASHFDEDIKNFYPDPNRENILVLQPGAVNLIRHEKPSDVLPKAERFALHAASRLPTVRIVLLAPNPIVGDPGLPPSVQEEYARGLLAIAQRHKWGFVYAGPLLMAGDKPNETLYVHSKNPNDTLHPNEEGLKAIGAAINDTLNNLPPLPKVP